MVVASYFESCSMEVLAAEALGLLHRLKVASDLGLSNIWLGSFVIIYCFISSLVLFWKRLKLGCLEFELKVSISLIYLVIGWLKC